MTKPYATIIAGSRARGVLTVALATTVVTLGAFGTMGAQAQELQPVVIRLVADHPPAPHPAALSQAHFQKRLPEVIPGSEVRIYHAGALYTIPEALEAMSVGDLEMTWGQFGKTAAADRWMNVVAGPMLVTTPAALEHLEEFETVQMLKERFAEVHDVKMLGTAHMSMYMGAGAGERLRGAENEITCLRAVCSRLGDQGVRLATMARKAMKGFVMFFFYF
jgi:TRAP-type C4-dicarboxylate transport system substrate-binding protein